MSEKLTTGANFEYRTVDTRDGSGSNSGNNRSNNSSSRWKSILKENRDREEDGEENIKDTSETYNCKTRDERLCNIAKWR